MADPTDPADVRLDDRLRAAMKSLDDQVPAGYFEALPNQILPRLEATPMHTETTGKDQNEPMTAPPSSSDDSGLHDIRSLAETTKKRLSKKITAQQSTDDLVSSTGSFRGIALPEPAKMVSLPELAELPSAAEVKAKDKAAKAAKAAKPSAPVEAKAAAAAATVGGDKPAAVAPTVGKSVAAVAPSPAFKAPAKAPANNNHTRTIALVGIGLAAAAGVALLATKRGGNDGAQAPVVAAQTRAAPVGAPRATAERIAPPAPAAAAPIAATGDAAGQAGSAAVVATAPTETAGGAVRGKKAGTTQSGAGKGDEHTTVTTTIIQTPKTEAPKPPGTAKGSGDPSFDDLLKEAGVQDGTKKEAAPTLAKKSLSTEDITHGMGALAKQAQGCYKGTQGQASVKLTVAPSGKVTKVTVGGAFAGTPEGQCVAGIAQSASFPPWDGGPQTVNYSYLLSE